MFKKKIRLIMINAAILVVLLVVEVIFIRTTTGSGATKAVVFAKADIGANTVITEEMLEVRKVDSKLAGAYCISDITYIKGSRASHDMAAGEMVYAGSVSKGMPSNSIKFTDPANRLFALELKGDAANGWWVDAEQKADVIFVPGNEKAISRVSSQGGISEKIEDVRIAAILDEKGNPMSYSERASPPRYVCLEVTPEQAEFLAYAKINGKIELAILPDAN